jgi:hypothetical protein
LKRNNDVFISPSFCRGNNDSPPEKEKKLKQKNDVFISPSFCRVKVTLRLKKKKIETK